MQQDRHSGGWGAAWLSLLLGGLTVGTGCTMCPSPFDYSGTVPGAANQNDFRVRNNGILPIWKRPRPWPPVVSSEPLNEQPAAAEPAARKLATAELARGQPAARRIAASAGGITEQAETVSVLLAAGTEERDALEKVVPAAGE